MNETEEEELFDHFSRLPESVIHQILSTLPFKDVVRCSVLSKTWNRIWFNYPNIALELRAHISYHGRPFLDHIEGILEQCLFQKACIQKLQLRITTVNNLEELAPNMDRWLGAAIERNVSELMLDQFCLKNVAYCVPERVVVAHSLKVLEVEHCRFEDSMFTCGIKLSHLQKLKLGWCKFVGENMLNKILSGCPVLEFLEVICMCQGSGSLISISCNPRLKYFHIGCGTDLKRIEIFAPSLETFKYISRNPCAIDLASCTALKHLYLDHVYLSAHHLPIHNLLSKLVCVESLELYNCEAVGQIKISSPCLKRLVLSYFSSFPGAIIDLPNLLDLDFVAFPACNLDYFKFSSWNVPNLEKVHMKFSVKTFGTFCRAGLEGFLMKLHNYESLKLFIVTPVGEDWHGPVNMILHEKLLAVPLSSLNKFLMEAKAEYVSLNKFLMEAKAEYVSLNKLLMEAKAEYVVISSRGEEHFQTKALSFGSLTVRLSLIFSSCQSIELLYENLSKACPQRRTFQLVSTEEIEHEMGSAWKSFISTHSTGYQTATIIIRPN